jgi:hypothetical protein
MKIKITVRKFTKPSTIAMVAVLMSFCAWLFPDFGFLRKGFETSEALDITSVLVLSCWYGLIFLSFFIGQRFGTTFMRPSPLRMPALAVDSGIIYYSFTFLSALGTVYTLAKIFSTLSLQQAIIYIGLHEANALKFALYEDYSIGFVSLRYLVVYSGSIALYRIIVFKQWRVTHVFNLLLLLSVVLISSRLIFVATIMISVLIVGFDRKSISINFAKSIVVLGTIFTALSVFNYSRNANFYESSNLSFAGGGLSEIITYLGSPFQVAIGSSKITDKITVEGGDSYRNYVDIAESLNTNSAFIELHEEMGYFCWIYIACICGVMGFVFSWLSSLGKTGFLLPCGAILYGSAELWRVDLFQAGIFKVWLIMGISVPLAIFAFERLRGCFRGQVVAI